MIHVFGKCENIRIVQRAFCIYKPVLTKWMLSLKHLIDSLMGKSCKFRYAVTILSLFCNPQGISAS